jgi:hypothetical protein
MSDSGQSASPRFSDDKQWWWTGSEWVPANEAPNPPPQAPARPPGIPPTYQPARQKSTGGGVPSWLAVVGLLFCFPIGIVLTLLTKWSGRTKAIAIGVVVGLAVIGGIGTAISASTSTNTSVIQQSPVANAASPKSQTTTSAAAHSPSPAASQAPKFITFGNGTFVVGKDIKPGTYRTRHDSDGCYFARLKGFGGTVEDIIANENTDARAVVTIAATDKGFQSENCDQWSSDLSAITTSKTSFGDGDFIVGTDMVAGTYRNDGTSGCYYARLRGFGHTLDDIIANNNTDTQAIVTIATSDKGFESQNCGTWTKIS